MVTRTDAPEQQEDRFVVGAAGHREPGGGEGLEAVRPAGRRKDRRDAPPRASEYRRLVDDRKKRSETKTHTEKKENQSRREFVCG